MRQKGQIRPIIICYPPSLFALHVAADVLICLIMQPVQALTVFHSVIAVLSLAFSFSYPLHDRCVSDIVRNCKNESIQYYSRLFYVWQRYVFIVLRTIFLNSKVYIIFICFQKGIFLLYIHFSEVFLENALYEHGPVF